MSCHYRRTILKNAGFVAGTLFVLVLLIGTPSIAWAEDGSHNDDVQFNLNARSTTPPTTAIGNSNEPEEGSGTNTSRDVKGVNQAIEIDGGTLSQYEASSSTLEIQNTSPVSENLEAMSVVTQSNDAVVAVQAASGNDADSLSGQDTSMGVASSSSPIADGVYFIRSYVDTRSVLDVAGGSKSNGANVQLFAYNATLAQQWQFTYNEKSGFYTIVSMVSGRALDISGGSRSNGANVQVYSKNGTAAQQWRIVQDGTGWRIESALKSGFVLDISGARNANGTNAQAYAQNGTNAQRFDLLSLKPNVAASTARVAEGAYTVKCVGSNKVLDVSNASRDRSGNVQQYAPNSTYAQSFYFEPDGNGFYRVFNVGSGLALDVSGADLMPGANVQQYTWNGTNAQLWSLRANSDGTCTFLSKANNLALDISGGSTSNGANVQMYTPNNTKAQKFTLTPVGLLTAGSVKLLSVAAINLAVGVSSGSISEGASVNVANLADTAAQKFVVAHQGSNNTLKPVCSSLYISAANGVLKQSSAATAWTVAYRKSGNRRGLVLTAPNGQVLAASGTKNGSALVLAKPSDSAVQAFLPIYSTLIDDGIYTIANVNGGKVLDATGGKRVNGTNVQIYTSNGTNAQKYRVTSLGGDWYTIRNASSGRALDVANGSAASGANVQLYKANGTNAQKWKAELLSSGNFRFVNAISGMVLEVSGAKNANGANVRVATKTNSNGQVFHLYTTSLAKETVDLGVPSIWQNPELPTGCESVALTNVLKYYGFNISKTEIADHYMPWSGDDFVYSFMGNPHSSYGAAIMAPGITNTANSFLRSKGSSLSASNITGTAFDNLYSYIDAGCPVVVWSTMYFGDRGSAQAWQDGYTMYYNTHAVTLAGYNANKTQVLVSDPLSGSVWREASRFRSLYDQMGRQAVVIQ